MMKIGRNDLCPCGSGKKYKRCCINKKQVEMPETNEAATELMSEYNDEEDISSLENMFDAMLRLRMMMLKRQPHIKKYHKLRNLHGEICASMYRYFEEGKFKTEVTAPQSTLNLDDIVLQHSGFDLSTQDGAQALLNILAYKNSSNINCITEVFLQKNRYRKPEKIEFLQSMLDSVAGLFEITKWDDKKAYVWLKDVLSQKEYCIIDIGLSGTLKECDNKYFYTRIITYQDISFGTGLHLLFEVEDPFIQDWIVRHRPKYNPQEEMMRFLELYDRYTNDLNRVKTKRISF